jgi:hypothetical protein
MDDFEELKRKKEYLELQNEVAKLERNQKINKAFNYLPYIISIPLLSVGLLLIFINFDKSGEQGVKGVIVGLIFAAPFLLKFFSKK